VKQNRYQKKVLKLARAIEQGCKKTKPVQGEYLTDKDGTIYACALGAAIVNGFSLKSSFALVRKHAPIVALQKRQPIAFIRDEERRSLVDEIVDRNDTLVHSRQCIANWLKRVAKLPKPPVIWSDVK